MNSIFRRLVLVMTTAISLPAFAQPVTAVLKLRPKISMQTLAQNVQNPYSDRYHKFYTPEEIKALSAPSDADYQSLIQHLKDQGFAVLSESKTHLWVTVRGATPTFENKFTTHIQTTKNGFHDFDVAPTMPLDLPLVEGVVGLSNAQPRKPKLSLPKDDGLSQTDDGVPQSTIKTFYGFDPMYTAGLTGAGEHIAIATYGGFDINMVNKFYQLSNLPSIPVVDQIDFNGHAVFNPKDQSAIETELDTEFSGMIAPGAQIHVFASASNDQASEVQMFTAILDDNRSQVVNYSWGNCEPIAAKNMDETNQMIDVFSRAVAQGINIMVASGDNGSDSCGDKTTAADWPGAAPGIVAVGGTSLTSSGETAWSGSGGGISALWDLPVWQQNVNGLEKRGYPDVAFNADSNSGQAIYTEWKGQEGWAVLGGTSMAAPQWTGFLALVGQARKLQNLGPVGYINPLIYAMTEAERSMTFHDVTAGTNGSFTAGPGWDAVTGFGSMQADQLTYFFLSK